MTALLLALHDGSHHDGWFPFFPLVFIGLWITLFLVVGRRWRHGYPHGPSGESVLAERFARGEIDEQEYHQRLDTLTHRPRVEP